MVMAIAVGAEGTLVSGGADNIIRVWAESSMVSEEESDAQLECVRTIDGHLDCINSLVVMPDGAIVSGSSDGTVCMWDATSSGGLGRLDGHSEAVTSLCMDAEGSTLVSGGEDGTLRRWAMSTGECKCTFGDENGVPITAVALSADSTIVFGGAEDASLRAFDAVSGKQKRSYSGHTAQINALFTSWDGTLVSAGGSGDNQIRVWAESGKCLRCSKGHQYGVNALSGLQTLHRYASGSDDRSVRLWDAATGEEVKVFTGHDAEVTAVVLLQSSVVSGSLDESIREWDLESGSCRQVLWGHTKGVTCLSVTTDFTHLFSGSEDYTVHVWALKSGVPAPIVQTFENHTDEVTCVCVAAGGERIVTGGRDARVCICDAVASKEDLMQEDSLILAPGTDTIATLANLVKAHAASGRLQLEGVSE